MTEMRQPEDSRYRCSFCGRSHIEVGVLLICAPASICDACIEDCRKIAETWRDKRAGGVTPVQVKTR